MLGAVCLAVLALAAVGLAPSAAAETFSGPVIAIQDGDTMDILITKDGRKRAQRIRFGGTDAPEHGQPFNNRSRQHLAGLIARKTVTVESHKRERYGRPVGTVLLDGEDIGLAMVEAGFAWWFRRYADEQTPDARQAYEAAETAARRASKGLWADPNPMPPWEYRNQPEPPGGYAAACPCDSGAICTGKRGGRFCVRASGSRRYYPRAE